jgi:hypothetical protein
VTLDSLLAVLFFALLVAIFLGATLVARRREQQRREALASVAGRLGFSFFPEIDRDITHRFRNFRGLDAGDNRYAYCVMSGLHSGRHITAFDFHYETRSNDSKGNRRTSHHYCHVVAVQLERVMPELFVAPENFLSKIVQALGHDDIDFESHEFSRHFCVRSRDRKFAYDFCNASMMDLLLAHPTLKLETRETLVASVFDGRMDPQTIEPRIDLQCEVRGRMPDYLFTDT